MAEFPAFDSFYAAANRGQVPFPWQSRLAEQVAESGWPGAIGVPTGLGKTACIDIAVWVLAKQAASSTSGLRSAATRIWYVVNRRLLVDAAAERAEGLARNLAEPGRLHERWPQASTSHIDALRMVGDALSSVAAVHTDRGPLHVLRLRGGGELGQRPPDVSHPTLILATVPMYASRLLFRGYGSSRAMSPVDAAMAGIDTLVLLDEAHLARPLAALCQTAAQCDFGDPSSLLPGPRSRPRLVTLTATGERMGDRFDLDDDDLGHPIVKRRLAAPKPARLVASSKKQLSEDMADAATNLLVPRPGSACVVFCNTVRRAREVADHLRDPKRGSKVDVLLLTGRMREREAEGARHRVLEPNSGAPAGRPLDPRPGSDLVVVCTQTLEVGADLDFDFLVTETAGTRALTQRLGRLNRFGDRSHAQAVICHPEDEEDRAPYGREPIDVWQRLLRLSEPIDLCPARVDQALGEPADTPDQAGELLPSHLWEFAKTSLAEPDEAPVEVFFETLERDRLDVSVCWRNLLPADGERLVPGVRDQETVDVPIYDLTDALDAKGMSTIRRLEMSDHASLEAVPVTRLRPGDTVVLETTAGLYDPSGWNPGSSESVLDVSMLSAGIMWLDLDSIRGMCDLEDQDSVEIKELLQLLGGEGVIDPDTDRAVAARVIDRLRSAKPHPWMDLDEWNGYLNRIDPRRVVRDDFDYPPYLTGITTKMSARLSVRAEQFEELSFGVDSSRLEDHQKSVAGISSNIAAAAGIPAPIVECLRLAGLHHDDGKGDRRFQRWLDPDGRAGHEQAKSAMPRDRIEATRSAAGWPRGGRHELLSARLLKAWFDREACDGGDGDLVLHLIGSHHGHGRPWIAVANDHDPLPVAAIVEGGQIVVPGDLSLPDWLQPTRFRACCERYGVWGLALLEAIIRQADHIASGQIEVG